MAEVKYAQTRIKTLETELEQVLGDWNLSDQARDLMALCGVDTLTAITVRVELGTSPATTRRVSLNCKPSLVGKWNSTFRS